MRKYVIHADICTYELSPLGKPNFQPNNFSQIYDILWLPKKTIRTLIPNCGRTNSAHKATNSPHKATNSPHKATNSPHKATNSPHKATQLTHCVDTMRQHGKSAHTVATLLRERIRCGYRRANTSSTETLNNTLTGLAILSNTTHQSHPTRTAVKK